MIMIMTNTNSNKQDRNDDNQMMVIGSTDDGICSNQNGDDHDNGQ